MNTTPLGRVLIEQVDVGDVGPPALEPCENDPLDGFAQRDRGRQFVIGDIDHRIHQPA